MTLLHRRCHRKVMVVLAVLLPLALMIGLMARRPVPVESGPGVTFLTDFLKPEQR